MVYKRIHHGGAGVYMLWCWIAIQDLGSSWIHQRCYRGGMVQEKGKQAEERQDEPRLWRPWRPPRRRMGWRVLWAVGMAVALLTTALLIVHLHPEIWKGLLEERNLTLIAIGVSVTAIIVLLAIGGAASSWTGFRGKTVWDLLQLLVVPLALAGIGLWFAAQQEEHQQRVEAKRAEVDREIEDQRAQDITLRTYLDQMGTLLLDRDLRAADQNTNVRNVARARTLTTLAALGSYRKQKVLRFLNETKLIQRRSPDGKPVISLRYAELQGVKLGHIGQLGGFELNGIVAVNADLSNANMLNAVVHGADLREADLSEAGLRNADLLGAELIGVQLNNTNLTNADLTNADLTNTDLTNADLTDAQVTEEQLEAAKSLKGATMPDGKTLRGDKTPTGPTFEDWLKDQESRSEDQKTE
jgi:uncharacterized protein YjbI with pentapeptide repeats